MCNPRTCGRALVDCGVPGARCWFPVAANPAAADRRVLLPLPLTTSEAPALLLDVAGAPAKLLLLAPWEPPLQPGWQTRTSECVRLELGAPLEPASPGASCKAGAANAR